MLLYCIVGYSGKETMKLPLDVGANVNIVDKDGKHPNTGGELNLSATLMSVPASRRRFTVSFSSYPTI